MRPAAALLLLAAACAAPGDTQIPQDSASSLTGAEAVSIFDRLCLASAPDFLDSKTRMDQLGLTDPGRGGTRFLPSGAASARVQARAGPGGTTTERCSVVFSSPAPESAVPAMMKALTARGLSNAPPKDAVIGQRRVKVWRVDFGPRRARVIVFPSQQGRLLPAIFIDVPGNRAAA